MLRRHIEAQSRRQWRARQTTTLAASGGVAILSHDINVLNEQRQQRRKGHGEGHGPRDIDVRR